MCHVPCRITHYALRITCYLVLRAPGTHVCRREVLLGVRYRTCPWYWYRVPGTPPNLSKLPSYGNNKQHIIIIIMKIHIECHVYHHSGVRYHPIASMLHYPRALNSKSSFRCSDWNAHNSGNWRPQRSRNNYNNDDACQSRRCGPSCMILLFASVTRQGSFLYHSNETATTGLSVWYAVNQEDAFGNFKIRNGRVNGYSPNTGGGSSTR